MNFILNMDLFLMTDFYDEYGYIPKNWGYIENRFIMDFNVTYFGSRLFKYLTYSDFNIFYYD